MRDAETAEFPSLDYPRIDPRQSYVWIRLGGQWREAYIHKWVHERSRNRWLCWTFVRFDRPGFLPDWYVYDPETIRQRPGDDAPPDA